MDGNINIEVEAFYENFETFVNVQLYLIIEHFPFSHMQENSTGFW